MKQQQMVIRYIGATETPLTYSSSPYLDQSTSFRVDKSMLVSWIVNHSNKKVIITRPNGWGKAYNMKILKRFFAFPAQIAGDVRKQIKLKQWLFLGDSNCSQKLKPTLSHKTSTSKYQKVRINSRVLQNNKEQRLKPTQLAKEWQKYKPHFANYIVIQLSYSYLKLMALFHNHLYLGQSRLRQAFIYYAKRLQTLRNQRMTYEIFEDLFIPFLQMLHQYHKKNIIILVEDYEEMFKQTIFDENGQLSLQQGAIVLSQMFDKLVCMPIVYKIVCTGIHKVAVEKGFFSNISQIHSLDKKDSCLNEYFGFTKEEIWNQLILENFNNQKPYQKQKNLKLLANIERIFGGYEYINKNQKKTFIFPSQMVIKYLRECFQRKEVVFAERQDFFLHEFTDKEHTQSPVQLYFNELSMAIRGRLDFCSQQHALLTYSLFKLTNNFPGQQINNHNLLKAPLKLQKGALQSFLKPRFQYTWQQMINHMCQEGYLVESDGHVTLSNLAYRNQLNKQLRIHLKIQFEQIKTDIIRKDRNVNLHYYLYNMPSNKKPTENILNIFLKPYKCFCEQFIIKMLILAIQTWNPQVINLSLNIVNGQGLVYYSGQNSPNIVQDHRAVISDGIRSQDNILKVQQQIQESLFTILKNTFIQNCNRLCLNADFTIRTVVGVYGYERIFKIYTTERRLTDGQRQKLLLAAKAIFTLKPDAKDMKDFGLQFSNIKILNSHQFIDTITIHFCHKRLQQNASILEKAKKMWDDWRRSKISRRQTNILKESCFLKIKNQLMLRFFGFRQLGKAKLKVDDLTGIFNEEQSIEPIDSLLEELQQILSNSYQIVVNEHFSPKKYQRTMFK